MHGTLALTAALLAASTAALAEPAAPPAGEAARGDAGLRGVVTGTVMYAGTESESREAVTRDASACGEPGLRPAGDLLVSEGRLASVVVWLPEAASLPAGVGSAPAVVDVTNRSCAFEPRISAGRAGGTLRIRNADPVLHGARLTDEASGRPVMNLSLPLEGQVIEKPLRRAGLMRLGCDVHEWMRGFVWVVEAGPAAVTGADGRFSLAGLPPGRHVVAFWHERLGERRAEVLVPETGPAVLDLTF